MPVARGFRGIVGFGLVLSVVSAAAGRYSGGHGTVDDPYRIATAADLVALGGAPEDYDKHFLLMADIDLDPNLPGRRVFDKAVIAPFSLPRLCFTGTFNGNGHAVSHLTITGEGYLGLFGELGGHVTDLGLLDVDIAGSGNSVGALAGRNSGYVTGCHSTGTVRGQSSVGGLVGSHGYNCVGELVRKCTGGMSRCHSAATVFAGGDYVGGLIGRNSGDVQRCFSTGAVVSPGNCVGGLIGENTGVMSRIVRCYGTGAVTGEGHVGGLVGWNNGGRVTRCYSTGSVSGTYRIGGLAGSSDIGSVAECCSVGAVRGAGAHVGGLIGGAWDSVVMGCFWDMETAGQAISAGGTGKTTAQMQDVRTYLEAGWDCVGEVGNGTHEIWMMPDAGGHPVLAEFAGYRPPMLQGLGTPDDPYLISSAAELGAMVHYDLRAHFRLVAAIDLSGIHWGTAVIPSFGGTFDGNCLMISRLTITGEGHLGLFGQLTSAAEVRDLGVVDVNVAGWGDFIGALAGRNDWGAIARCYSTGAVTGDWSVGGLVGANVGPIDDSYSTCVVSGNDRVGGLTGYNWPFYVTRCHSAGAVRGTGPEVGGLIGCGRRVADSFWDVQTSGQVRSDGGTGLTTEQMRMARTFLDAGWDFVGEAANGTADVWWIDEHQGYPRLSWETAGW